MLKHSVNFCSKYECIPLKASILMLLKRYAHENCSSASMSHLTAGRVSLSSTGQRRLKDYVLQFTKSLSNRGKGSWVGGLSGQGGGRKM